MKIKLSISFLFTIVFIYILYHSIGFGKIVKDFSCLNIYYVIFGFLLYAFSSFLRAYRWHSMIREIKMWDFFIINNIHIFSNNIMPARTGELSFFYLIKKRGVNFSKSFWIFLLARLMDALALSGFFVSVFFKIYFMPFLLFVFGVIMIFLLKYSINILPNKFFLKSLKENLTGHFEMNIALRLYILSLASFFIKFLSFYIVTSNLLKVGFLDILPSYVIAELSSILPINGIMGLGTYELGFSAVSKITDIGFKNSLNFGFITHVFLLLSSSLLGIISIILYKKESSNTT